MPRSIPSCPASSDLPRPARAEGNSYEIELITPMFGGGVEPRVIDRSFAIRPTAIRGQLQFWWRATVGARFNSIKELRSAQSEVWGSTEHVSPVVVRVEAVRASDPVLCVTYRWDRNARRGRGGWRAHWDHEILLAGKRVVRDLPSYALFPFQGKSPRGGADAHPEEMPARCVLKASFTLRIECPASLKNDIETAVGAWVNFGGLGCRTRRGCGALFSKDVASVGLGQRESFEPFLPPGSAREWPTVGFAPLFLNRPEDPLAVWGNLIEFYRHFRQGEEFARNPGQGRSRYPEPETIRRITGRRMRKHPPLDTPDGFPRAELGLPIVFHFKDEDQGEPPMTTLNPLVNGRAIERMASPLILKPVAISSDKAIPMILRLNAPPVEQVELQDESKACLTPKHAVPIRSPELAHAGSPLHGLTPTGSALEAFLTRARSRGFQEVTP